MHKDCPLTHLLQHCVGGQLLQVLQVGVEKERVRQSDLQQRLDDVANGAVIWESDLFCCGDEISQTENTRQTFSQNLSYHLVIKSK